MVTSKEIDERLAKANQPISKEEETKEEDKPAEETPKEKKEE